MLVVSESYQNDQKGVLCNQLTDVGRGGGKSVLGLSFYLLIFRGEGGGCTVLYTAQSIYIGLRNRFLVSLKV